MIWKIDLDPVLSVFYIQHILYSVDLERLNRYVDFHYHPVWFTFTPFFKYVKMADYIELCIN